VKLISLKFIQSVEGLSFHVVKRRPLKYLRFAARHSRGGAPPEWIRAEGGRCEQSGRLIAILGTFRTHGTATGTASTCRVPRCARSHFIYPKTHRVPTNCKLKMSSKAVISTNNIINLSPLSLLTITFLKYEANHFQPESNENSKKVRILPRPFNYTSQIYTILTPFIR
jgi:hypothetical protein